jgi:hypothetical protein
LILWDVDLDQVQGVEEVSGDVMLGVHCHMSDFGRSLNMCMTLVNCCPCSNHSSVKSRIMCMTVPDWCPCSNYLSTVALVQITYQLISDHVYSMTVAEWCAYSNYSSVLGFLWLLLKSAKDEGLLFFFFLFWVPSLALRLSI